ncbi:hypothetical protein MNB_ARC-1_707 [hydrothermal vent metagenome]|uniref:DUF177 domain-containing protein n=1 Tax=hydrothermal vent metagenome TaxID=652676 RepID=A0A3B1DSP0_9ZZZZ
MKIDFKKVSHQEKTFDLEVNSVKFCGTFGKIPSNLVNVKLLFEGFIEVLCCKCGIYFNTFAKEENIFLLSDGAYSSNNDKNLDIIIEVDNGVIDFEEIFKSELESFKSEYHVCDQCK